MADVKPTRSELIDLRRRITLAKAGHHLLEKKRDGLVREFFIVLKGARRARREMIVAWKTAAERLDAARALHADTELESLSLAVRPCPAIEMSTKNIMGTLVPSITAGSMARPLAERGYGLLTVSSTVNEACGAYGMLLDRVLSVAEVETTTRKLIEEIGKTKRRVNALEFEVIPTMTKTANDISFRLDEIERETIFRTKMIKRKLEQKGG